MASLRQSLTDKDREIASLKTASQNALAGTESLLSALRASHKTQLDTLNAEITSLKEQIENLKRSPVDTPAPKVDQEPLSKTGSALDELLAFAARNGDYSAVIAKGRELGVFKD